MNFYILRGDKNEIMEKYVIYKLNITKNTYEQAQKCRKYFNA